MIWSNIDNLSHKLIIIFYATFVFLLQQYKIKKHHAYNNYPNEKSKLGLFQ